MVSIMPIIKWILHTDLLLQLYLVVCTQQVNWISPPVVYVLLLLPTWIRAHLIGLKKINS